MPEVTRHGIIASMAQQRNAPRLYLKVPVEFEVLPAREMNLTPEMEKVFESVTPASEGSGLPRRGRIYDISSTGAFIVSAEELPPILSRVFMKFDLPGHARVQAVGWVLWRRTARVKTEDRVLERGFGVLFEYIPIETRIHIERLIAMDRAAQEMEEIL